MNFTYCDLLIEWFNAKDEQECDGILKKFQYKYSLPVGEVVKCIMKIINISKELQNACMYIGDTELEQQFMFIEERMLKYVVTNSSLYV